MLLDNEYTIIPSIKFSLTFDNDIRKIITVKTRDKISCLFKKNGEKFSIVGIVSKIGCNFNSSLGTVGTTAYLQVDGSSEYCGVVEYIQPEQVLDLTVISTTDAIENVVCSVDNEEQRISLIRENEVGVMQYSIDGITWRAVNGAQGMSAYESAVKLGFEGSEKEWIDSLKSDGGTFKETFITMITVGGLKKGSVIHAGDTIASVIRTILCGYDKPAGEHIYWGSVDSIPQSLDGLKSEPMRDETLVNGVTHGFNLCNQYPVFAYRSEIGPLKFIRDGSGFDNIHGWSHFEYVEPSSGVRYYIYYSDEPLTICDDFLFTFLFK